MFCRSFIKMKTFVLSICTIAIFTMSLQASCKDCGCKKACSPKCECKQAPKAS